MFPDRLQPFNGRPPEVFFGGLVLLSGMAALGHQLMWTRRLVDLLGASGESTARVLGTFFFGLAIGSAVAALVLGRTRNPLWLAGWVQLSIPLSVGPAWLIAGLIFPFAIASAGQHCSATQSGQRLGLLLAINGLGGLLGAELTYRFLLPAFGVYGTITTIGFSFAASAFFLSLLPHRRDAHMGARFAAVLSAFGVVLIGLFNLTLPVVNPPPGVVAIDIHSGREGTVAVIADTFAGAFGETHLFMNHFRVSAPMLALVGGRKTGCLDWDRVSQRCKEMLETDSIRDPVLRHESGIRLLYLGRWQGGRNEARHVSLSDPSLEYSAATVRLSADAGTAYYNPAQWIRFCRSRQRLLAAGNTTESSVQADLTLVATGLLELDHAYRTQHELADTIAKQLSPLIPSDILEDGLADWHRWPGDSIPRHPPDDATDPSTLSLSQRSLPIPTYQSKHGQPNEIHYPPQ